MRTSTDPIQTPLAAACELASRGWHILPLAPRSKIPLTTRGLRDATSDEDKIRAWYAHAPRAGVGVACAASGLVAIDVDRHAADGEETLRALEARLGALPSTVAAATGGGGRHLVFAAPPGVTRVRGTIGPGVDVKHHGYIVVPPSIHPSGEPYRWIAPPWDAPIASLPDAWIEAIAIRPAPTRTAPTERRAPRRPDSSAYALAALDGECSAVRRAQEGERNSRLNRAAYSLGQLVAGGELAEADAVASLSDAASACGLPEAEARRTIASGMSAGMLAPRRAPEREHARAVITDDDAPPWEPPPSSPDGDASWTESLVFRERGDGERALLPTPGNLALLLAHSDGWAGCLARDELAHRVSWIRSPPAIDGMTPPSGALEEHHCTYVRHWMVAHHGVMWTHEATWQACHVAAAERSWHPVQAYLDTLIWDGVPRVDEWLVRYLGAAPSSSRVGAWWLISAVARAMRPGCQADHALILEGPQGAGKSTALRVLAGDWYQGALGDLRDKDGVQSLLGAWIVEISELDAIRGQAATRVKEFLTQSIDRYRPSYGRTLVTRPRSCVFAGTTNDAAYLTDSTGARRFWPVAVTALDLPALERDRDQIWAEAAARYRDGERWWPSRDDVRELAEETARRQVHDPWESAIAARVSERPSWSTREILDAICGVETARMSRADAVRVAQACRAIGMVRYREPRTRELRWRV